ncbi:putative Ig domain-containing protein [Flammeovirga yaeyamensis]|uniref:Ig domain-containing protein n=1 Tax=Flammeovirga yaeyamensis TaxID=367791 RepID=A0AAX1NCX3_9BACT|nr:putative Ig domain-containing protein [Flammeovirga yaeyamensis]MBB3696999.1 hypothetical protein [Flammeovirga yaeyamensis]NMF33662.1 hypothetical protein [Flammeovirga yaeyamensis]QWG05072.1 putative Ig domain-containing protein [Flammeovirga yaeyamensis]
MKNKLLHISFYISFIALFFACDKDLEAPDHIKDLETQTPTNLNYEQVDIGYVDTIFVSAPTWEGTSYVRFFLDSVSSDLEDFDYEQFQNLIQVDNETGEIILTSTANIALDKQALGHYFLRMRMDYLGGSVYQDSASIIQLMDLPFVFNYSDAPEAVAFSKEGIFATPVLENFDGIKVLDITYSPEIEGVSIDTLGQLTKTGTVTPVGEYTISLEVETDKGPKSLADVYTFTLNPIAIDIEYEDALVDFMKVGEIATPKISTEEDIDLSEITYSITDSRGNPETGDIVIDPKTGVISKVGFNVPNGTTSYHITLATPIGDLLVENAFVMTVGNKPEITYRGEGQSGNVLQLAKLTPWTPMKATITSEDVTENPVYKLSNIPFEGISINPTTGAITVAENSNVADGEYPISVTVDIMLDGEVFPIDFEVFIIQVSTTWEEHFFTDFEFAANAQSKFKIDSDNQYGLRSQEYGDYHFRRNDNGVKLEWVAGKIEKFGKTVTKTAMSNVFVWNDNVDRGRSGLIKNIDVESDWRQLEVSFTEQYNNQTPVFTRHVQFGYDNDPTKVYDKNDWTEFEGLTWSSTTNWPSNPDDLKERNVINVSLGNDNLHANQQLNILTMIEVTEKAAGVSIAWGLDEYLVKVAKTADAIYE